ncbi:MAG: Ldh family oxidoreductase, partial [Planctomycetes bacterium]|nr:Ldh family oxidoreductase [Planctomycetota bacterium]
MPVFSENTLRDFAQRLLEAGGVPAEKATIVANSLVLANLCGYDSHGVMRIPFYVANIEAGRLQPEADLRIERETPAVIVGDGGWGMGQVICRQMLDRLFQKAAVLGIASGSLRRTGHIGRLGEYAEWAAEHGMVTLLCCNNHGAAQRVAPIGGKRPRLGTNPMCIG